MRVDRLLLPTALVLAVACGGSTGGGSSTDGGATDAAASPADGGGVCCPISGTPPCGCAGGGGWAASASACTTGGTCDAWFDTTVDVHGCPALVPNGSKCCGCPPLRDAGLDAPGDAAASSCTTASDCRLFSDDCGGCTCDALGVNEPNPTCDAGVSCLVDPCQGKTAACDSTGRCVAR